MISHDRHVMPAWCTCDAHVILTWCTCDAHVIGFVVKQFEYMEEGQVKFIYIRHTKKILCLKACDRLEDLT